MNCWFYYSPGTPEPVDVDRLDARAAETLATRRWRGDLVHWHEVLRPATVATSRALLAEDLTVLSDAELADHLERTIEHFLVHGPQHFEAVHGDAAAGALLHAARDWDLDPRQLVEALAGQADASTSAERLFDRIAEGLRDGRDARARRPRRRAGGRRRCGRAPWTSCARTTGGGSSTTTSSSPRSSSARPPSCRRSGPRWRVDRSDTGRPGRPSARCASACPEADRDRFDELVADARAAYGANDDNTTVLFALPLGLVRRAALEVGRRLVAQGRADEPDHVLDAERAELAALLRGGGPSRGELADRAAARIRARAVVPPPVIGSPSAPVAPPALGPNTVALVAMLDAYRQVAWRGGDDPSRAVATVGDRVVRGRAVVATDPTDALMRIEPGDVLVVLTTTASYNTIFPAVAAVAVQHGGLMSHAAVLARELGLPALIGVPDLMDRVHDGDQVEVDPVAGTITVVSGSST